MISRLKSRFIKDPTTGEVNLMTIIFTTVALLAIFLAVDGYQQVTSLQSAQGIAGEAARVAAGKVSGSAVAGSTPALDPYEARAAALTYMNRFGVTGTVNVTGQDVTVTVEKNVTYLMYPGPPVVWGTATASARHQLGNQP
ncbi:MAG: hypothetical protein L0G87_00485 [Renibacterium salmoninarum]|jgi:hypothetical protein|nr:hypothetical protein [Renibacterium salmoninarum]